MGDREKHGHGAQYYFNSKGYNGYYEGEWENGKKHGNGAQYFNDNSLWFDGLWQNGVPVKTPHHRPHHYTPHHSQQRDMFGK